MFHSSKIKVHKMNLIKLLILIMKRKMKNFIRQILILTRTKINLKLYLVDKLQKHFRIKISQISSGKVRKACIKPGVVLMKNTISWVHLELVMESNFIIRDHSRKGAATWWKWLRIAKSRPNNKVQQSMNSDKEITQATILESM